MMKSIPQLRELEISGCKGMSRIVAEENGLGESSVDEVEFPQLARLKLKVLPNLVSFFPKVTTALQPLFNGKVAIPMLKYLELKQLNNLSDIWFSELPTSSFSELKELKVAACKNLRSTFHPSMVKALANLEKLVITNCSKMKAVVDSKGKGKGRKMDKAMFPQLREMELNSLPNLKMFCPFTCPLEFPLLSQMGIQDCPSMDAFSSGHLTFPKLCLSGTSKDILYRLKRFAEEQGHLFSRATLSDEDDDDRRRHKEHGDEEDKQEVEEEKGEEKDKNGQAQLDEEDGDEKDNATSVPRGARQRHASARWAPRQRQVASTSAPGGRHVSPCQQPRHATSAPDVEEGAGGHESERTKRIKGTVRTRKRQCGAYDGDGTMVQNRLMIRQCLARQAMSSSRHVDWRLLGILIVSIPESRHISQRTILTKHTQNKSKLEYMMRNFVSKVECIPNVGRGGLGFEFGGDTTEEALLSVVLKNFYTQVNGGRLICDLG
ncbi:hypothetical protein Vadar_005036 [Vaccinium darrowii]|uniref:Uncharacterized protein n=1 Tax=Vaccinium darrowii TaxID=229202 RepID=A0ACB7XWS9_9ERIC|nr:hypothetical protein Vadar_005036 [Vaccinium darrowii]